MHLPDRTPRGHPHGHGPELSRLDDAALAALLHARAAHGPGADAVMAEVFARHHGAVLAYARTCCRDAQTAQDLAAEAFARTYRAVAAGGGPHYAWRPYLLTCVRRVAIEWSAEPAVRPLPSDEVESWAPRSTDEDAAHGALAAEERSLVARAYRSLPDQWQAVLWHSVVEDETADSVGRRLGLSPSGVRSLAARAREGLREAYLREHLGTRATAECRHYGRLLSGSLRRPGRRPSRELDRHLAACADCARAAEEMRVVNSRLSAVLPVALLSLPMGGGLPWAGVGAGAGLGGGPVSVLAAKGWSLWAVAAATAAGVATTAAVLLPAADRPQPSAEGSATSVGGPEHPADPSSASPVPAASPSVPSPSGPSPTGSAPSNGRHRLVNARNSLCAQAGPSRGVDLQQCRDRPDQFWQLLRDGDDVRIMNVATGLCLGNGGQSADQAPVLLEDCAGTGPGRSWRVVTDGRPHAVINRDAGHWLGITHWADPKGPGETLTQSRNYYNSPSLRWILDGADRVAAG
ncbi:sigma-70 family RNA polymerase sigma factor [Kitasatospora sp. NPDC057015]|uniref:sigma-70 family RNA polymerase sigma factor n=1 Tax=Kitasatospora sp. NPDC057015 TaxID=3346001 RepID=UPI003643CB43